MKKIVKRFNVYIIWGVVSLSLLFMVESIWRGSISEGFKFLNINYLIMAVNLIIIMMFLSWTLLVKRKITTMFILSFILIFLAIINKFVVQFRGIPVSLSDLFMLRESVFIVNKYIDVKYIIIYGVMILLISLFILFLSYRERKCISTFTKNRLISVTLFFIMGIGIIKIVEPISLIKNPFNEKISYYDNGLIYSFVNSNVELNYAKPLKYNNENIEDLIKHLEQENSEIIQDDYDLNVIFVQLESFFDPMILNEIKFIKDPIPIFRELTDNYSSGLISVPTFGGSTVRTEFELLTGTNLDYFSPNEIPYNTIGKKVNEIYSLAQYFNELGYTTTAFHNNTQAFFNRKMMFSKMQFDEFFGIEQLVDIESTDNNWYEDAGLIPYIQNRIQQTDEKDFIMGITVQLHGPYDKEYSISHNQFMDNSYEGEEYNQLAYYLDTISKIDDFIEDMINMINELDEKSIIVFYSDHYPNLDILNASRYFDSNKYEVPYVIYDNIGLEKNDKNLESYQLGSYLIDVIGYPKNNLSILHNNFSNTEWYQDALELLQYNILFKY